MTSRILDENLLSLSIVSNATVSSEQAAFPVSNLYNAARRSKVWRSNGYWEITADNNELTFRETLAVDLVATVAVGNYTSNTALFAAIKTALEDAGASTYTVSVQAGTNKLSIVSNGGGGGGIFQLIWTSSTDLAQVLGYDHTTNDTGSLTYIADYLRIGTGEWIKWDFGISTNPEAFCLIGKRNEPIAISPSAVIKLQANETDVWTSPQYEQILDIDDRVITLFKGVDDEGLHTEALRYWRLLIEDLDNPNGYVEAGSVFLGNFFEPERGAIQIPFDGQYIDRSETVFSEGGQTFSDVKEKAESFSVEWFGLTIAEKEEIDLIFDTFGTNTPFFISIDPNSAMSTSFRYYLRYVKFSAEPGYQLLAPGVFSVRMDLREEL